MFNPQTRIFQSKQSLGIFNPQPSILSFVSSNFQYDHKFKSRGEIEGQNCNFYECARGCMFRIIERLNGGSCSFEGNHTCSLGSNNHKNRAAHPLLFPFGLLPPQIGPTIIPPPPLLEEKNFLTTNTTPSPPSPPILVKQEEEELGVETSSTKSSPFSPIQPLNFTLGNKRKKYMNMNFVEKSSVKIRDAKGRKGAKNLVQFREESRFEIHRFVYHDRTKEYIRYSCRNRKKKKCNVVIYERIPDSKICIRGSHSCLPTFHQSSSSSSGGALPMLYQQVRVQPRIEGVLPNRILQGGCVLRIFVNYPQNWPVPNINQLQVRLTSSTPMNMSNNRPSQLILSNQPISNVKIENQNTNQNMIIYQHMNRNYHPITFVGRQSGEECGFFSSNLQVHLVLPYFFDFQNGTANLETRFLLAENDTPVAGKLNALDFEMERTSSIKMESNINNNNNVMRIMGNNVGNDEFINPRKTKKRKRDHSTMEQQQQQQLPYSSPYLASLNDNNQLLHHHQYQQQEENNKMIFGIFPNQGSVEGGEFVEIYCSIPCLSSSIRNLSVFFGQARAFVCSAHPCDENFPSCAKYEKSDPDRYRYCRQKARQVVVIKTPPCSRPCLVDVVLKSANKLFPKCDEVRSNASFEYIDGSEESISPDDGFLFTSSNNGPSQHFGSNLDDLDLDSTSGGNGNSSNSPFDFGEGGAGGGIDPFGYGDGTDYEGVSLLLLSILNPSALSVESIDVFGKNLLHHAVIRGKLSLVKFLVSRLQFGVNRPDKFKNSPLHYAVLFDRPRIYKFLVSSGANEGAKNVYGVVPLEYIRLLRGWKVQRWLDYLVSQEHILKMVVGYMGKGGMSKVGQLLSSFRSSEDEMERLVYV